MGIDNQNTDEITSQECKSFIELIDKYCDNLSVEHNSSEHTIRNYKNDLYSFTIWCDRMDINPISVNYRNLRGYLAEMDSANYARTTINRRLSSLKSFFRWLDLVEIQANNYVEVMKGPKLLKALPKVVRHNDMENLMKQCCDDIEQAKTEIDKACAIRDYAIFECLYATGARISEMSALLIDNINFENGQIKIFGKGKKERIVPIYNIASESLYDYIHDARPVLLHKSKGKNNDLCFIGKSGKPMSADSMRKMFYSKCEKAGVSSQISPHTMRHTFATDILDGGADLRSVQELLGHVSLSTTQIYTHLSAKKLKSTHSQAHPRA